MTVALASATAPTDANLGSYLDGWVQTLVAAQPITVTDNTPYFSLPYMAVGGKVKLVVNISALTGGSSPTLTVALAESIDGGTSYNGTAALTTSALNATGVTYTSAASGPVFAGGRLSFTIGGTGTPTFTTSVFLVAWNR